MILESWDIVFYTFLFVVPGYIIEEVVSSIIPIKRREEGIKLIRCLMYSVVNNALWFSWGLNLLLKIKATSQIWFWALLSLSVIVTGLITGLVIGLIKAKGLFRRLFNKCFSRFGVNLEHPIPSAWDYVFKNFTEGAWVTIRMDNDKFIRGKFYTNSFASSDEDYRDLYLEEVYILDENEEWVKINRSKGMWLSPDTIKHIEFLTIRDREGLEHERKEND